MTTFNGENISSSGSSPSLIPKYQFYMTPNASKNKSGLSKLLGNNDLEANHSRLNKTKIRDIDFNFSTIGKQTKKNNINEAESAFVSEKQERPMVKTKVSNPEYSHE